MGLRDELNAALRSLARRPGFAAVVMLTLALTAALATFGPALRAAQLDPARVLRAE